MKRTLYNKHCKVCNVVFQSYDLNSRYCNRQCKGVDQRIKNPEEKFLRKKFQNIKMGAIVRKIPFDLKWTDLQELNEKQNGKCYYSGISMQLSFDKTQYKRVSPFQLTVDRKDNEKGYTKDNILLCCYTMNSFKMEFELIDIKKFFNQINENQGKFYYELIPDLEKEAR